MTRSRWLWALVRVQAAMVLLQAVLAGGFLSGRSGLVEAHGVNAGLLWLVSIAVMIVSIVAWRRGRTPGWVATAAATLWVALEFQIASGEARALWIHVPLGMAIFGTCVVLVIGTGMRGGFGQAGHPKIVDRRAGELTELPPPPPVWR